MTQATMMVFSSPTCPHCPAAKNFAEQVHKERDDVRLQLVTSGTPGAEKLFRKYDVASVPTVIIKGDSYDQNIGLRGAQSPKTLHKYVDLALGIEREEEVKEKKSLFSVFKRKTS